MQQDYEASFYIRGGGGSFGNVGPHLKLARFMQKQGLSIDSERFPASKLIEMDDSGARDPKVDNHYCTGGHFSWKEGTIIVDMAADFRDWFSAVAENDKQILGDLAKTKGIFLTHIDKDHFTGILACEPLVQLLSAGNDGQPLKVWGNKQVIKKLYADQGVLISKENGGRGEKRVLEPVEIEEDADFEFAGLNFKTFTNPHAYRGPEMVYTTGFRVGNFGYATDMDTLSETSMEKLVGAEVLFTGWSGLKRDAGHINLKEGLDIIAQLQKRASQDSKPHPHHVEVAHLNEFLTQSRMQKAIKEAIQQCDGLNPQGLTVQSAIDGRRLECLTRDMVAAR